MNNELLQIGEMKVAALKELAVLQQRVFENTKQDKELSESITDKQNRLKEFEDKIETLKNDHDAFVLNSKTEKNILTTQTEELKNSISERKTINESLKLKTVNLESYIEELENKVIELKEEVRKSIEDINSEKHKQETQIMENCQTINKQLENIGVYNRAIEEKKEEFNILINRIKNKGLSLLIN